MSRRPQVIVAAAVAFVVMGAIGSAIAAGKKTAKSRPITSTTGAARTTLPTTTTAATAVAPATLPKNPALLGATRAQLRARFGASVATTSNASGDSFDQCRATSDQGRKIDITYDHGRAVAIDVTMCAAATTTNGHAFKEALLYLPPDAKSDGRIYQDASGHLTYRLTSPSLGRALPASWFIDCNRNAEPRGTIGLTVDFKGWKATTTFCADVSRTRR